MQLNNKQKEAFERLSRSQDGQTFISFLNDLIDEQADIRKINTVTSEEVRGRQIACNILEVEVLSRFSSSKKEQEKPIINEFI